MKYKGFCSACDVEYVLSTNNKDRYPATYCPGCGNQMPNMIWKEIAQGASWPCVEKGPAESEKIDPDMPDIVEAMVALSAKIYDVLSPTERLMFWQIVRNALNKNL